MSSFAMSNCLSDTRGFGEGTMPAGGGRRVEVPVLSEDVLALDERGSG